MTLENFERIKRGLDELGIYYTDGNYYKDTSDGEVICGHWLEIKGALIETSEISKENSWQIALIVLLYKCQEGTRVEVNSVWFRTCKIPLDICIIV